MKKSNLIYKVILLIFLIFSFSLSISAIVLVNINTSDVEKCINRVVEIKSIVNGNETFGSGTIIENDGLIITNAHVVTYKENDEVKKCDEVFARLSNEETFIKCELKGYNYELDLAKLKADIDIKGFKLRDITYQNAQEVFTISNSMNYGISYTKGIISRTEVIIDYHEKMNKFIQADINASSGSSGGAPINKKGNLIGIITFRSKDTNNNINYEYLFCTPLEIVRDYVNS